MKAWGTSDSSHGYVKDHYVVNSNKGKCVVDVEHVSRVIETCERDTSNFHAQEGITEEEEEGRLRWRMPMERLEQIIIIKTSGWVEMNAPLAARTQRLSANNENKIANYQPQRRRRHLTPYFRKPILAGAEPRHQNRQSKTQRKKNNNNK